MTKFRKYLTFKLLTSKVTRARRSECIFVSNCSVVQEVGSSTLHWARPCQYVVFMFSIINTIGECPQFIIILYVLKQIFIFHLSAHVIKISVFLQLLNNSAQKFYIFALVDPSSILSLILHKVVICQNAAPPSYINIANHNI